MWRDSHIDTAYSLAFLVTVPWPAPHTQQELNGCLMEWLKSRPVVCVGMLLREAGALLKPLSLDPRDRFHLLHGPSSPCPLPTCQPDSDKSLQSRGFVWGRAEQ